MKKFTLEELAKHHEATGSKVSEYVAASDYDALAAQIEVLQKHIERVALCYYNNTGNEPSLSVFHRALDEAESAVFKEPQECLAEIRADAGRDGFVACADHYGLQHAIATDAGIKRNADAYAEQIRQGGAA
jgi:hypothetical protein